MSQGFAGKLTDYDDDNVSNFKPWPQEKKDDYPEDEDSSEEK